MTTRESLFTLTVPAHPLTRETAERERARLEEKITLHQKAILVRIATIPGTSHYMLDLRAVGHATGNDLLGWLKSRLDVNFYLRIVLPSYGTQYHDWAHCGSPR